MNNDFSTADEIAKTWGVSARYVQYLCREGKIGDAVKRAGVWFIPGDAPPPPKSLKANNEPYTFSGTKKAIFDSAISLFTKLGYENVAINDIAKSVGIRQSAVYNHFKSKLELLETIYDYYRNHYINSRPGPEVLEKEILSGSLIDIIVKGFNFDFDESIRWQMGDITKLILERAPTDIKAAELFRVTFLEEGVRHVAAGLDKAVGMGRLAPFDTRAISLLINSTRVYIFLRWLVEPLEDDIEKIKNDEQVMYGLIAGMITDLKLNELIAN